MNWNGQYNYFFFKQGHRKVELNHGGFPIELNGDNIFFYYIFRSFILFYYKQSFCKDEMSNPLSENLTRKQFDYARFVHT